MDAPGQLDQGRGAEVSQESTNLRRRSYGRRQRLDNGAPVRLESFDSPSMIEQKLAAVNQRPEYVFQTLFTVAGAGDNFAAIRDFLLTGMTADRHQI